MEKLELFDALSSILGELTDRDAKVENYNNLDETIAERVKNWQSLKIRQKEYNGLIWAAKNPHFDYRTLIPKDPYYKIRLSQKEVYEILMKLKAFYEVKEYELLTDNRKPKDDW